MPHQFLISKKSNLPSNDQFISKAEEESNYNSKSLTLAYENPETVRCFSALVTQSTSNSLKTTSNIIILQPHSH